MMKLEFIVFTKFGSSRSSGNIVVFEYGGQLLYCHSMASATHLHFFPWQIIPTSCLFPLVETLPKSNDRTSFIFSYPCLDDSCKQNILIQRTVKCMSWACAIPHEYDIADHDFARTKWTTENKIRLTTTEDKNTHCLFGLVNLHGHNIVL